MTQGIEIKITVPAEIYWDEEVYVARCPSLKVSSQGNTIDEAHKNIEEAISILIEDCIEYGTLEEVLKDCGNKQFQT
jgi:predicted RNase H-like HicB family nuclease